MISERRAFITITIMTVAALHAFAQQPTQFKANVTTKDGSNGKTSSGTMYFGGTKMRAELTSDGQNVIVLVDPAAKTQYMLMPSEKAYMQMPIGQGPGSITVTGPSDPTNPCATGSGNADCVKGDKETLNGYEAVRWDYTNSAGVRTRAWISTKLRFPIKTQDDDGSSTEFSNIAEGPQPATLFGIPPGYQKMDISSMGGRAGRGGRGSNADNPMAALMANVPAEQQAAVAAALRGEMPKGMSAAGATGSAWEKTNGFVVNITITASQAEGPTTTKAMGGNSTEQHSYSIKWVASIPLNFVTAAAGVPGTPGPIWTLLAGQRDLGIAAANRTPITLSVTTEAKRDQSWTSDCKVYGEGMTDPGSYQERMSSTVQKSASVTEFNSVLRAQGNLTLSADLKTYDLVAGLHGEGQEVTKGHTETTGCRDKQVHKDDKTVNNRTADYGYTLELRGQPLPATMSTISGTKKMPVRLDSREMDATVSWTITPIR